ncbi:phenolic glucoside malonyltransferase 1 [Ricinus communis]|uniref:Anthocyanin 5-aromatic acyltransferase, putative n=1 Tax=Ricinus communis TaxID=3988 RepID=B9SNQ7_RICCO|nr:phenolic glucoside malonyltransferase 1 [Ricinus communis]EEF34765.1 Anthocyanin 5-aromatic acyltransferase, putative [Ricinus communis]|eukprot:XP_002527626.1 phenolic glucoside malonyltransferase 1 [Ricinus communis]
MASPNSLKILEVCQVSPASHLPHSASEFSLPATFFDLFWLKFPPVERLFFYHLTQSTPDFFNSVILPKLKHSLSLTLLHFFPIAGRLTWPLNSPKPVILYCPNDGLPLTVAESDADFDHLSSTSEMIEAIESHPYVPELPISETSSSILALQITLFPSKGFAIGCSSNHAILDGKSSTMFIKAWAYICKHDNTSLLPELAPSYDRNSIKDASELETVVLSQWAELTEQEWKKNPRSLKVLPTVIVAADQVRSTFQLTPEVINKLKNKVLSKLRNHSVSLSAFVLICAYVSVCMVKARGGDENRKVCFVFAVDCRSRIDPPLPMNYFGNGVFSHQFSTEAREFMEDSGVSSIAERISGIIKGLEKDALAGIEDILLNIKTALGGAQLISLAGSTRFGVYGCDFGWGKPKKVEITSIDRTGAIALTECRDGNGGVEIGLALPRHEMEAFSRMLFNGLNDL